MNFDSMSEELSLIVLPFHNSGGDTEQRNFSDSVTEDLITALMTRVPSIKVVSRSSSFHYRDRSPTDIRKELHVRFVLEGSIRRAGSRVRVFSYERTRLDGTHV